MKTSLRTIRDETNGIRYEALMFACPGCASFREHSDGLHMLPVNTNEKSPSWDWNGDREKPTLTPSIKTSTHDGLVCHSFLRDGIFEYLNDSTHKFSGQKVDLPDLPQWAQKEGGGHGL